MGKIFYLLIYFALITVCNSIYSQTITVDSVKIIGNKKTKTRYLERFLTIRDGGVYEFSFMEEDMRKLRTLSSILDVEALLIKKDTTAVLSYFVNEKWTLLPVGDFGVSNNNVWVGMGLMESNLFGQGIYCYGYLQYKVPFAAHFILRQPYFLGSRFGYEFQFRAFENSGIFVRSNVDLYEQQEIQFAGKYEMEFEKDILLGVARREERVFQDETLLDKRHSNRYFVEFRFQKMDYRYFLQSGWKNFLLINITHPVTGHSSALSFYNELRLFKSYKKLNLAARFILGASTEKNVYFLPYFIDSYSYVRGSAYRGGVGNRLAVSNIECRYTIYEGKHAGIQLVGFSDFGQIRYQSEKLTEVYSGIGSRFIIKKIHNAVFSIDYGANIEEINQGGWVVGWGQYF